MGVTGIQTFVCDAYRTRYPYQVHNLRHYTGALTDIRPQDAGTYYGRCEETCQVF